MEAKLLEKDVEKVTAERDIYKQHANIFAIKEVNLKYETALHEISELKGDLRGLESDLENLKHELENKEEIIEELKIKASLLNDDWRQKLEKLEENFDDKEKALVSEKELEKERVTEFKRRLSEKDENLGPGKARENSNVF